MSAPPGRINRVRVAMLGPLNIRAEDGSPVEVTTSRLVDGVWGDEPPAEAANALQALVSRLRRTGLTVESRPTGYRLALDPDGVDVHRFERLVAKGRANSADTSAILRETLALWRGPAHTDACPASGSSSVASTRTAVVLPAPLGPSRPRTLPAGAARSTPSSAFVSPNRLASPSANKALFMCLPLDEDLGTLSGPTMRG